MKPKEFSRRELRTREAIMDAFEALLSDQEVEKITVSAIARKASVDRKTFYLHYKSVDELATYKTEQLLERILNALRADGQGKPLLERTHIVLEEVNRIVSSNIPMYTSIANTVSADRILRRIDRAAEQALSHAGYVPETILNQQLKTRLQFVIAGAISLYFTWLRSDHSRPIESVSASIEDTLLLLQNSGSPLQPSVE